MIKKKKVSEKYTSAFVYVCVRERKKVDGNAGPTAVQLNVKSALFDCNSRLQSA